MSTIVTSDGVTLHADSTGAGAPLLFIHEFAGDHRSWEPQVRYFGRSYRCVTYAARGYPPSDVPADPAAYSQQRAMDDAVAILDGLGIDRAHVVGLSMGGFTALHLTLRHPARVSCAVVAGAGYGAAPERAAAFRAECLATAAAFETEGAEQVAQRYADLNREFHFTVYSCAGSPLLLTLMRLLWASLHGGPRVQRSHAESARQHDAILDALRAGDAAAASARTYQHIMGAAH